MTRLISGVAGGRRLKVPRTGVRPTGDRAREALFNSLTALLDLRGAAVLDLYAGSGALGLEALSRGAETATMVEDDPSAVAAIRANIDALGLPGAFVVAQKAETFLANPPEPRYDLALLDPPYEIDVAPVLVTLVPWIAEGGVVMVERRTRNGDLEWPSGLLAERSRRYGEATLWYASRVASVAGS